mgnify:CR=1 FL=1
MPISRTTDLGDSRTTETSAGEVGVRARDELGELGERLMALSEQGKAVFGQLEEQGIPDPDVTDLEKCYKDPQTLEVITRGRTRGIFYIESPAQSRLNKKAGVESFEELTIASSLVRPAGSAYCNEFIDRHRKTKMGVNDWEYLHPSLEPVLKETCGILAFQEDVTKVCHKIAGLSYRQADKIRKMMNSLHEGSVGNAEWKEVARGFIDGCMNTSGLSFEQATDLWKMVSSFTGFSFCKSHSASYAQLSFQCSYLKAYYPAQFIASVISNEHGFYTKEVYLNEARRWGISILPMNINASRDKYWGKHSWIRPGMMQVRNLTQKSLANLLHERRENGDFRNLVDFIEFVHSLSEVKVIVSTLFFRGFLTDFGFFIATLFFRRLFDFEVYI